MDDSRLLGRSYQLQSECLCSSRLSSRLSATFSSFLDIHHTVALTGQPNYQTARVPVFTTLNIAVWRELLSGYLDEIICEFLEFGWPIGYTSDTLPIFDLRTHRGALDLPDQVNAYLSKELKLGRIAGPFDTVPLAQGFVVSPLNTVEKRDSEERRGELSLI